MWRDKDAADPARARTQTLLRDISESRRASRAMIARLQPGTPLTPRHGQDQRPGMQPAPQQPAPQDPGPPEPLPPAQANDDEPFRIGLNQTRCFAWTYEGSGDATVFEHDADRYGPPMRSFGDAPLLGVGVFRQIGDVDLTWPGLSFDPDALVEATGGGRDAFGLSGVGLPVPHWRAIESVTSRLMSAGPGIVDTPIVRADTIDRLLRLLTRAHQRGVKVILTFLHLGNGGSGTSTTVPDETSDPTVYGTVPGSTEYTAASGRTPSMLGTNHRQLVWADSYVGTTIADDELPHIYYDFPQAVATTDVEPPHLHILDPWCPYKRQVIHRLAVMAGAVLRGIVDPMLAKRISGYSGLGDVIYGIELFNEVDHNASVINDSLGEADLIATGEAWGRTCYHAARGLRTILEDAGGVRILLPGLSSYALTVVPTDNWEGRIDFVRGLARGFAGEFRDRAAALKLPDDEQTLDNILDLLQGMDVHNYHFRPADGEGPIHAGLLALELSDLRDAIVQGLDDIVVEDEDRDRQLALFADFPLTCIETTTTVVSPSESDVSAADKPDFQPFSSVGYETFQAWEVWRRLGSALAANARVAGWHSWMGATAREPDAKRDTPFAGSGLREDIVEADLGTRRFAWTAVKALAAHLGRASWGQVLLPVATSRDELLELATGATGDEDRVVVFEYRVGSSAAPEYWYYLVLVDPAVQPDRSWPDAGVQAVGAVDGEDLAAIDEYLFLGLAGGHGSRHDTPVARSLPLQLIVKDATFSPATLTRPRLFGSTRRVSWETFTSPDMRIAPPPAFVLEPAVRGW